MVGNILMIVVYIHSQYRAYNVGQAHDNEIRAIHAKYLDLYPFEGDITYTDFDYIFGHQDDEFYSQMVGRQVRRERSEGRE